MISAEVNLETENPQRILDSLKPDMEDAQRFSVKASVSGKKIVFKIEANDIAALKAALNSYLRLVQVAQGLDV
ncbi:MAG: KEOPS complex subunit Pcc1 [archaeon]